MGPTVTLNNGITMPRVGFGVFQVDEKSCEEAVLEALQAGYRLIDTARAYNNEAAVGRAVRRSGLKREELFITSKAFVQDMSFAGAKRALDETLSALQTDYIDLYLIHMPYGDYYSAWRSLEEEYVQEKIRALGVSNFLPDRLLDLVHNVKVIPAVNQIECHPFYQREAELKLMEEKHIVAQAWAPFAEGLNGMFSNPVLREIAAAHQVSVAQVILRWDLQRGVCVIPKSVHRERMEENRALEHFALNEAEMQRIAALDLGHPQMLDPLKPSEVERIYNYLENPVLTSLQ